jgi:hypothetical protein
LRCAGQQRWKCREINHFFTYDERAFQRGALRSLGIPGSLNSISFCLLLANPNPASHSPRTTQFAEKTSCQLAPGFAVFSSASVCGATQTRKGSFHVRSPLPCLQLGVIVIFTVFLTCGPRCAACAINSNHASARASIMFHACSSLQVQLAICHQIIYVDSMVASRCAKQSISKHPVSLRLVALASVLITKTTSIIQLYCTRSFSTWKQNSKVLIERAVYC